MFMQQVIGCVSQSSPYPLYYDKNDTRTARDGVCDGVGCCQVALSSNMSYYAVNFDESYNTTNISITNSADYCGYAAIMETSAFKFRTTYLYTNGFIDEHDGNVPVILNWAVGNESCDVARMKTYSYACRSNYSVCTNSASGPGYLCNCAEGYQGNPYLPGGCQGQDCMHVYIP